MIRRYLAGVLACLAAPASAEPENPVQLGAGYTSDSFFNLDGGLRAGFRQMGLAEVTADADLSSVLTEGATGHASVQWVHGESLSGDLIGDAQVHSNIDAPDAVRLFEAWVQLPAAGKGRVKAGLVDLNGDFDVQTVGALFLNSSHGIGPDFSQTGLNGPSIFPITSGAVVLGWDDEGWSARLGLFDAVAGQRGNPRRNAIRFPGATGLLLVAEGDVKLSEAVELQAGAWQYSGKFETIELLPDGAPDRRRGNRGAYLQVEGRLGSVAALPVDGWVRVGTAATRVNAIGLYTGGGIAVGPEESRCGLALARAQLGRPARRAAAPSSLDKHETVVELTYSRTVTDWLTVQPDLQYVINPGWDPGLGNALVAGVRLHLAL
uniref:carbohydrate porin n=1 Tax=uncultured Sphingomonas sp. TaxID=158754 RepID=UPI0025D66977|nr:carbohydrate porin [uncultured Sphingomonas sp.]